MAASVDGSRSEMIADVKYSDHQAASAENSWSDMSADVVELVFSKLPAVCVCKAACTCKRWHSLAKDPNFLEFYAEQENSRTCSFKVSGVKYSITDKGGNHLIQSVEDHQAPTVFCPEEGEVPCMEAAGGLNYAFTGRNETTLRYKLSLLEKNWRVTSAMPQKMHDPIVGVLVKKGRFGNVEHKLVVAGGDAYVSENEDGDDLSVSLYNARTDSWEACEPLPSEFSGNTSSLCMGSVIFKKTFYAYDKCTGCVSRLDTESKRWSGVKLVRPPADVNQMYLVSRSNKLCLVGIQDSRERDFCVKVWKVDEETMEVGELLHSTTVLNPRVAAPSLRMRQEARAVELFARFVGLFLILVVYCIRLCHLWKTRTVGCLKLITKVVRSKQEN